MELLSKFVGNSDPNDDTYRPTLEDRRSAPTFWNWVGRLARGQPAKDDATDGVSTAIATIRAYEYRRPGEPGTLLGIVEQVVFE